MGKRGKKQSESHGQRQRGSHRTRCPHQDDDNDDDSALPSSAFDPKEETEDEDDDDEEEDENEDLGAESSSSSSSSSSLSKFHLYQLSVQSPKGDITYLQKFFLMYVGGRQPLHLQEDFCGTALLSTEWLRTDSRRTAVGLDLDLESLNWCLENNLSKVGSDGYSRLFLFHGNVLTPNESTIVKYKTSDNLMRDLSLSENNESGISSNGSEASLQERDIVCAFNYSCCCLHKRKDLVLYFKHALNAISKKGGIFVMDLYGGTSSECKLRLQRKFPNFTYMWEQDEFDIVNRETRISLHFQLGKKKIMRHAFSYHWRLWSIVEIKECMQEAGFKGVHVWMREMPDTHLRENKDEYRAGRDVKYEEVESFQQTDAWNAYVVGVANF
ncbi:hypothetical protein LUZ60_001754 [Juncus effusus]|nr:hypothetical protein LUZ60_001754 [Juncus effusus]